MRVRTGERTSRETASQVGSTEGHDAYLQLTKTTAWMETKVCALQDSVDRCSDSAGSFGDRSLFPVSSAFSRQARTGCE